MKTLNVVSYDIGQSGGKIQLGRFNGSCLASETVFKYHNSVIGLFGQQYWDFMMMLDMRNKGLAAASNAVGGDIAAVSTTTFGNTPVLFDAGDRLFSMPYGVTTARLDPALREVDALASVRSMHLCTGCENRNYITAAQLTAYNVFGEKALLDHAQKILLLPDALNYTLSAVSCAEITAASTGGMLNARKNSWDTEIMRALDLDPAKFPRVVAPGTVQGPVRASMRDHLRLMGNPLVVNGPGHDTASAAYALPSHENAAFISMGTMALMCFESPNLIANDRTFDAGLCSWASPDRFRLTTAAIRCLWRLEKCMEYFAGRGEALSYEQIIELARTEPEMRRVFDPDDDGFMDHPEDVPNRIAVYCAATGQPPITNKAQLFRCVFDSIAWAMVRAARSLRDVCGLTTDCLYILGGVGRNPLLMQLLADCLNVHIRVPCYEATSFGVLISELIALGKLKDRSEAKDLIIASVEYTEYEPQRETDLSHPEAHWQNALRRISEI